MSGADAETEAYWDDFFQSRDRVGSGRPNAVLARETADLDPGSALDLGCGEGDDAIWLAQHGWRVTAVDVSPTALARAAQHAKTADVADMITWERHDLALSYPTGTFDLVSAQFFHSPVGPPRDVALRAAASAVAPGGVLLIVSHAAFPPWALSPDPTTKFPTPEKTLESLHLDQEAWEIVVLDSFERSAQGPNGQQGTLTDSVVKLQKRTA